MERGLERGVGVFPFRVEERLAKLGGGVAGVESGARKPVPLSSLGLRASPL